MTRLVLFVSAEYPPVMGGVSLFSRNIVHAMLMLKRKVRVLTLAGEPGTEVDDSGVVVSRVRRRWLPSRIGGVVALATAVGREWLRNPRSILICGRLSFEGPIALLGRRLFGRPYALVVHGSEVIQHRSSPVRRWIVGSILRNATALIANSRYTANLVKEFGVDDAQITVIHPLIDPANYQTPAPERVARLRSRLRITGRRMMLTVGQLTARKGHAAVIAALARLRPRLADLVYVIVGGAGEGRQSLEDLVRHQGLQEHVVFTGHLDDEDVHALYASCDVYVMPCRELAGDVEGFGISFAEAGLFEKPVVGGIGGGTADAIVDGETGILIDPGDIEALTGAISRLLGDPKLASELGRAGRRRVLDYLTIEAQLGRLRCRWRTSRC
jgi:phosphatidylinositol alpha-1,6-mannosyltransferase